MDHGYGHGSFCRLEIPPCNHRVRPLRIQTLPLIQTRDLSRLAIAQERKENGRAPIRGQLGGDPPAASVQQRRNKEKVIGINGDRVTVLGSISNPDDEAMIPAVVVRTALLELEDRPR